MRVNHSYARRLFASAFLLLSCGRDRTLDPSTRIVAEVDGRKVSAADLRAYLDENLVESTPEEPVRFEEMDRVKSRLLDNLLEEEMLSAEAQRRDIRVTEEEVATYLESAASGDPDAKAAGPQSRDAARRELTIQKLRESDARERSQVTPAEVEAYAQSHAYALSAKRRIRMRSLRFDRPELANEVRRGLLAKKLDLARAIEMAAGGQHGDEPLSLALQSLPESVRKAVEDLGPGELSEPVTLDGATFLFLVEANSDAAPLGREALHDLAREELMEARYGEASAALLRRLRESTRVVIHEEVLPFRYVAESDAGGLESSRRD